MRSVGVICVGLGVVMLVFSMFPIVLGENATQRSVGLGCAGFLALPLVFTGMFLTRRAAARAGPNGEAAASAAFLRRATRVLNILSRGRAYVGKADPHGTRMERFRAFDLNRLTLAGWLLVLTAAGLLLGAAVLFDRLVLRERQADMRPNPNKPSGPSEMQTPGPGRR